MKWPTIVLAALALSASPALQADPWLFPPAGPDRAFRNKRFQVEAEYWSKDEAFKKAEQGFKRDVSRAAGVFKSASGVSRVTAGQGVRLLYSVPWKARAGLAVSLGYVKGPQRTKSVHLVDQDFGSFHSDTDTEPSFWRILFEPSMALINRGRWSLGGRAGVGYGFARIAIHGGLTEGGRSYDLFHVYSWRGFTWEAGPTLTWSAPSMDLTTGVSFAVFPTRKEDAMHDEFKWRPVGLRLGVRF